MIRTLYISLFLSINALAFGQLDAYLDSKYFNTPEGPIYETYMEVYANSVAYVKGENGVGKCAVEVTQILRKEDSVVAFYKFVLENAEESVEAVYENLMDVKRFSIENNVIYTLDVTIQDLNVPNSEEQVVTRNVISHFSELQCEISDIELLASFAESKSPNVLTKSGYDLLPLLTDFYPPEFDKIAYYFEVYNTEKAFGEEKFIVTHYLENAKTGLVAGNYGKLKRESAQVVIPVLNVFDISSLPSGSYHLVAEVRDKENKVIIQKKIPFSRHNLMADMSAQHLKDVDYAGTFVENMPSDSLLEFIYCLYPIVGTFENRIIDNQMKDYSDSMKRQFIYSFWLNMNSTDPHREWLKYKEQVQLVNHMFSTTVKQGYETDRGRIYLKYGPPNRVDDRPNEPSSYPYQIWHFYKIGKFNNKTFVFYQPDLVTNDYMLLHTDLQGEIQNFKWQKELNSRNSPGGNIDDSNEGNYYHYGTNSNTLFENP